MRKISQKTIIFRTAVQILAINNKKGDALAPPLLVS